MTNIEAFNVATAVLFGKLYGEFPRPVALNTDLLREEAAISPEAWWDHGSDNLLAASLRWLNAEGYVRFTGEAAGSKRFANVVLTARGLAVLNRTPEPLTSKPTIGDRCKHLAGSISAEVATALVRLALGGGA